MRSRILPAGLCLLAIPVFLLAQPPAPSAGTSSNTPFLEPGHDYHIGFPEGQNPFVYTASGITESYEKRPDGSKANVRPTPWSMKVSLDLFHVVSLSEGPWVLVEHPANSKDYAAWAGKHRAQFLLSDPENLDEQHLARVTESAARQIPLTRTWINTDHAVTIKPVSKQSLGIAEE